MTTIDETDSNCNCIKPNSSEGSKRPFNELRMVSEARKETRIIPVTSQKPRVLVLQDCWTVCSVGSMCPITEARGGN
jgi:hypothetical protein